jgi:hypothetical protein
MIPSVHDLICACTPGPHSGFSPIAWQAPSFSHGPNVFGTINENIFVDVSVPRAVIFHYF